MQGARFMTKVNKERQKMMNTFGVSTFSWEATLFKLLIDGIENKQGD